MNIFDSILLRESLVRFAKDHPSDGWGGLHTTVSVLQSIGNMKWNDTEIEEALKWLHNEGLVYLQKWNQAAMRFLPWDSSDANWLSGMFRLLPERP